MFFSRKNKKNEVLKDKINQFINTFEDKLDTNVDLVNQKAKENVLNDRKIYNYLVELAGKNQVRYILPNDFNKIQSIFIDLRLNKIEQAKRKMEYIDTYINFYNIDFDTFYNGLSFKYKDKLIRHYKNIRDNACPNITGTNLIPNGLSSNGCNMYTYIDSFGNIIERRFI